MSHLKLSGVEYPEDRAYTNAVVWSLGPRRYLGYGSMWMMCGEQCLAYRLGPVKGRCIGGIHKSKLANVTGLSAKAYKDATDNLRRNIQEQMLCIG